MSSIIASSSPISSVWRAKLCGLATLLSLTPLARACHVAAMRSSSADSFGLSSVWIETRACGSARSTAACIAWRAAASDSLPASRPADRPRCFCVS